MLGLRALFNSQYKKKAPRLNNDLCVSWLKEMCVRKEGIAYKNIYFAQYNYVGLTESITVQYISTFLFFVYL